MGDDVRSVVIVGASLAGTKAAEALRKDGYDGRVVLVGEDPNLPYIRPPLSKDYLRGESGRDQVFVHPATWYEEQRVELELSTIVTAIDHSRGEVAIGDGRRIAFDRLLLATGSRARRLDIPGADLGGVLYLRTIEDAEAIRAASGAARRVAVIGGGWIGAEVAASIRQLGPEVAMVAPGSVPLERVLGTEVGTVYRDLHAEHGVELVMGQRVTAFRGQRAVEGVETADGNTVAADLVVVGVGAAPRTELAVDAGLEVASGVVVNEYLESSVPGIFAAGDVAEAWHPVLEARIRIEHWDNARRQGRAAGRNMLGRAEPYVRMPYFYSDQYDLGMEYTGFAPAWDRVLFRGDPASRQFLAFWIREGRVAAGMSVNTWQVIDAIAALVASRRMVDLDRLTDPAVALDDLDALVAVRA
jgi:3-phenylpropionate/trans-cinnamate dioxygenase ferredoxin reductase subunit